MPCVVSRLPYVVAVEYVAVCAAVAAAVDVSAPNPFLFAAARPNDAPRVAVVVAEFLFLVAAGSLVSVPVVAGFPFRVVARPNDVPDVPFRAEPRPLPSVDEFLSPSADGRSYDARVVFPFPFVVPRVCDLRVVYPSLSVALDDAPVVEFLFHAGDVAERPNGVPTVGILFPFAICDPLSHAGEPNRVLFLYRADDDAPRPFCVPPVAVASPNGALADVSLARGTPYCYRRNDRLAIYPP